MGEQGLAPLRGSQPTVAYMRGLMQAVKRRERTLLVHPDHQQAAETAALGLPHITVKTSTIVTPGVAYLIDENALDFLPSGVPSEEQP